MISIIVPVYNAAPYLACCLDSLLSQTYRDLDIVCVDNGSTDSSPHILADYAARDARITVVTRRNEGVSEARNAGLSVARGEWTMFVDSDDWIDEDCCANLRAVADDGTDWVLSAYLREFRTGSAPKYPLGGVKMTFADAAACRRLAVRVLAPYGSDLAHPDKLNALSPVWGKLYRTEVIRQQELAFVSTSEIGNEDLLFNLHYVRHVKKAVYLPACHYHYRKNNISFTNVYKPRLVEQWQKLFERIGRVAAAFPYDEMQTAFTYRKALCLINLGLNITFSQKNVLSKRRELNAVVCAGWYQEAVGKLPLGAMPPHWRLFYGMARRRMTTGVLVLLLVIKKIINR